jgi:multicomponent K+:H+ antiporter subunit D
VPYGIVLVADRLAALMLVLTGVLGLTSVLYATARWHRAGVHFHPLFQLQLMGLNGAFLTGDLFNLFVFFEVMLAASYGLLLHGSGGARVRSASHYIAINLIASSLLLIGIAMLYGVTGTLNLADMAQKLAAVPLADRGLLHAGVAILAVAFLAKAAVWPLGFWLAPAYAAASAPAAALFVIMTKVGVYAIIRLSTLFFSGDGVMEALGADCAGRRRPRHARPRRVRDARDAAPRAPRGRERGRVVGHADRGRRLRLPGDHRRRALLSRELDLRRLGALPAGRAVRARARRRHRPARARGGARAPAVRARVARAAARREPRRRAPGAGRARAAGDGRLPRPVVHRMRAGRRGLPPLSGFMGKVAMLSAALDPSGLAAAVRPTPRIAVWVFFALLIFSGLVATLALSREGIQQFWQARDRRPPRLRIVECVAVAVPLLACVAMAVGADRAMRFAGDTARALHRPTCTSRRS